MLGCVRGLCTSRASGTNAPACPDGPTTCMPAAFGRLASTPRVAPIARGRCRSPGFDPPSGTHALAFRPRPSCQEVKKMHGGGIVTGAHARAAKAKAKEASPGKPKRTAASPKAAAESPAKAGKGGQLRLVFATPPRAARERASPPVSPSLAQAETQLEGTGPQEDAPQQQASGQAAAALALPAPASPRPTGPSTTPGEPVGGDCGGREHASTAFAVAASEEAAGLGPKNQAGEEPTGGEGGHGPAHRPPTERLCLCVGPRGQPGRLLVGARGLEWPRGVGRGPRPRRRGEEEDGGGSEPRFLACVVVARRIAGSSPRSRSALWWPRSAQAESLS
jgi:hypothetical protein